MNGTDYVFQNVVIMFSKCGYHCFTFNCKMVACYGSAHRHRIGMLFIFQSLDRYVVSALNLLSLACH